MKLHMNLMGKLMFTGLLCLLLTGIVPMHVHAQIYTGDCGATGNESGVQWSYDTDTTTLTISGSGDMADYVYWSDRPWNAYIDTATIITVGDQITKIGNTSFCRDSSAGFCSVTIPVSVTEIGEAAFKGCKFSSLSIDWSKVETIGRRAFEVVTFPAGTTLNFDDTSNITSIADWAFQESANLTSVIISKPNITIGNSAFKDNESLASVSITGDHTSIGEYAFYYQHNNSSITAITIGGQGTTIGEFAFYVVAEKEANVNSLTLLEGITTIEEDAFNFNQYNNTNITTLILPMTLTDIGSFALDSMGNLQTLYIPGEGLQLTNNILHLVNPNVTVIHAASTNVNGISSEQNVDRVEYTVNGSNVSAIAIDGTDGTVGSVAVPMSIPRSANSADGAYSVTAVLHKQGVSVSVPSGAADIIYEEEQDGTVTITDITQGNASEIVIPTTINGKTVANVENVPDGVTLIHTHHYVNGVCTICGDSQPQAQSSTEDFGILMITTPTGQNHIKAIKTIQGAMCQLAFTQATPAGYQEAFSFNLFIEDIPLYYKKKGEFTVSVPKKYQQSNRSFAVIGINLYGKTQIFIDTDSNPNTFTFHLEDFEGYAFDLIYTDNQAMSNPLSNTGSDEKGNYYIVQKGDVLCRIAGKLGKTRWQLIDRNNLDDPNKLWIGQKIYY